MTKTKKGLTRRRFLESVGLAGGSAAVYETMTALGLINLPEAWAGPPQLAAGSGAGKKVIILGAGIGGLTAAYELTNAGYKCQIIELTERPGGRNHTARRGTVLVEKNSRGETLKQVCKFDEGLYLNLGPGRLPYHHRRVLHYCRQLGVKLEVYVMELPTAVATQNDGQEGTRAVKSDRGAQDAVNTSCCWLVTDTLWKDGRWGSGSTDEFFYTHGQRDYKKFELIALDTRTGKARQHH